MELKAYQRDVLKEIGRYARTYAMLGDAATAYGVFLGAAGLTPGKDGVAPYHDDLSGVPRVCAKVPTGGGKTLIGAAAVGCIFDALPAHDEVVVWLVPRREILSQTLRNLRDPDHFLRQTLDRDFAGRVEVLSKEDGLAGRGFNANTMGDGLTVFVLSYDSFKNKEGRRAYAENSALAGLTELQRAGGTAFDVDGADGTALISALAGSSPLVVVDESHHAGSRLSVDMLRNLNPRFVLELTATPDARRTNVIAQATARQLKREEMVKLPVVVYRRPDKRTVVQDAVMLQRRLEAVAESDERRTGRYIRPIVLFQAERRDAADAETYELLRDRLVALVLSATTSQFRRTFGEEQMRAYIRRIADDMDQATVEACFDSVASVATCVQDAVRELASEHCESRFEMMLTNGSIVCEPSYKLPDSFRLARPNTSYAQTLYEAEEGGLDGIELKMADLLSNSGRIRWWHRVAERREGEFCINGFINHYPDFLAQTTDGVVLAIETKGGHLIGEDSEAKLRLGTRWADMAGREFRYVMVFESQKLDMANSLTLAEFSSGVLGC